MLVNVNIIEDEDIAKLHQIADRLGDVKTLSFDERRDIMNKLCLIISNIHLTKVGI